MTSGANVVEVGTWEPMQGLVLEDDLFPHVTGGLRGRVLTVASMDVSNSVPGKVNQKIAFFRFHLNVLLMCTDLCWHHSGVFLQRQK